MCTFMICPHGNKKERTKVEGFELTPTLEKTSKNVKDLLTFTWKDFYFGWGRDKIEGMALWQGE